MDFTIVHRTLHLKTLGYTCFTAYSLQKLILSKMDCTLELNLGKCRKSEIIISSVSNHNGIKLYNKKGNYKI